MGNILNTPFNEAQVKILKLFSGGLTDKQLDELRQLLTAFKFQLLDAHIEKVMAEKALQMRILKTLLLNIGGRLTSVAEK